MQDFFRRSVGPFFALGLVVLILFSLTLARDYAVPVAIAVFVWMLINAMAAALRRIPGVGGFPHWVSKLIAVAAIFGAMALAGKVIATNVTQLGAGLSVRDSALLAQLSALASQLGLDTWIGIQGVLEKLELNRILAWGLSLAQELVSDISLVVLYVLFLLVDERYYDAKMRALFPDAERRTNMERSIGRIGTEIRVYVWLMFLISLGVAVATWAVCAAVGINGPGFWGFLAFALNFVPTLGSIAAVVLPAVFGLLTLQDPVNLVILVSALAGIQVVAGEVILPRVMGARLNLSSVVILLMLVVWGAMWGPAGMFLAIPMTVIVVLITARFPTSRPIAILLSRDGRLPEV